MANDPDPDLGSGKILGCHIRSEAGNCFASFIMKEGKQVCAEFACQKGGRENSKHWHFRTARSFQLHC
jgi:hypothetical protein